MSLLREVYIDAYLASAENYRVLRAEVEAPEKAALVYRDFVREAVRRCVLDWKAFLPQQVMEMAAQGRHSRRGPRAGGQLCRKGVPWPA